MERVEPVLLHIATIAARFAPEAQPWSYLLRHLPRRLVLSSGCSTPLVPLCQPNRRHFFRGWPGYQMASAARTGDMSNPLRILRTLDRNLTLPAEITLFGRSALALGYPQAPRHFHNTQDVDGILPLAWLQPPDAHQDFWQAVERTNIELESDGLYLTHLIPRK